MTTAEEIYSYLREKYSNAEDMINAQRDNINWIGEKQIHVRCSTVILGSIKGTVDTVFLTIDGKVDNIDLGLKINGHVEGTLCSRMDMSCEHVPELRRAHIVAVGERKTLMERMNRLASGSGAAIKDLHSDYDSHESEPMCNYLIKANGTSVEEVYSSLMNAYGALKQELHLEVIEAGRV